MNLKRCFESGKTRQIAVMILLVLLVLDFFKSGFIPSLAKIYPDFSNYFIPAKIYRDGGDTAAIHNPIDFQRKMSEYGVDSELGSPWYFPPFSTIIFLPVSHLDIMDAKRIWNVFNLFILLALIVLIKKWTSFNIAVVAALVFLSGIPLKNNFLLGHFYLLELFLILLAFTCCQKGLKILSGGIIAFCAAVKISPVFILFYFLIKKEWKAFVSAALFFLLFLLIGFIYLGKETNFSYLFHVFPRISSEMFPTPFSVRNQSIFTVIQKIFLFSESLNPHPLFDQPGLYIFLKNFATICPLVVSLAVIMNAGKDLNNENIRLDISLLILAMLFVWGCTTYHFTLLIVPVILLLDFSLKRREYLQSIIILGAYILCGTPVLNLFYRLPEGILSPLRYVRVWLLACLFMIAIRCFITGNGIRLRRISLKIFAASGTAAIVLSLPYVYGLKSIEYDDAVLVESGKHLYLYGPSVRDDILTCYGADDLAQGRYILFSSNNLFSTRNYPFNAFDPDLSADGREVIFEVLKDGRSRIGKLAETGALHLLTPENMDCRYPIFHPNGRQFACSCKHNGTMDICLRDLSENHSNASAGDGLLTDLPYNETEPHISPDGKYIAYCSDRNGISKIYCRNLFTLQEEQITTGTDKDRHPRWSPDGKWIAFYSFRNGRADIWVVDAKSKQRRRITKDRANDTHPCWGPRGQFVYFCSDRGRGIFCPTIYKIPFEEH